MPGLFSRIKTWIEDEAVKFTDLNGEFDNVIANFEPDKMDDRSPNVAAFQADVDPGEVGTESLPTTLEGEIDRLRFAIKDAKGTNFWYESPGSSLADLSGSISVPANRIVSGRTRSGSGQPLFLQPDGTAAEVTLLAATTDFKAAINGTIVTFTDDVTLTGLSLAPGANNTALVNDAALTGQANTRVLGEGNSVIPIDTAGTEITGLVGQFAAFKKGSEVFIGFVKSSTEITKCFRGFFFDSTDSPIVRETLTNNDTITLLRLTWIFAKNDGVTITSTLNNVRIAFDQPSSPSVNDFWFDLNTSQWKRFSGSSFDTDNSTLIGICAQDSSATIAARSFDFFNSFTDENTIELEKDAVTRVKSVFPGGRVSVYGKVFNFEHDLITWDITLDLDSGVSEAASTQFFTYIKDTGDVVISDKFPHDRRDDLKGFYHPHHNWRCMGRFFNDSSSDIVTVDDLGTVLRITDFTVAATTNTFILRSDEGTVQEDFGNDFTFRNTTADGVSVTVNKPGVYAINYLYKGGTGGLGISLNSTALTSSITTITTTDVLIYTQSAATGIHSSGAITYKFRPGDIIRPHTDAGGTTIAVPVSFHVRSLEDGWVA